MTTRMMARMRASVCTKLRSSGFKESTLRVCSFTAYTKSRSGMWMIARESCDDVVSAVDIFVGFLSFRGRQLIG